MGKNIVAVSTGFLGGMLIRRLSKLGEDVLGIGRFIKIIITEYK